MGAPWADQWCVVIGYVIVQRLQVGRGQFRGRRCLAVAAGVEDPENRSNAADNGVGIEAVDVVPCFAGEMGEEELECRVREGEGFAIG